jgi:hypothetical protein
MLLECGDATAVAAAELVLRSANSADKDNANNPGAGAAVGTGGGGGGGNGTGGRSGGGASITVHFAIIDCTGTAAVCSGSLVFADKIRPQADQFIKDLHHFGLRTIIMSVRVLPHPSLSRFTPW